MKKITLIIITLVLVGGMVIISMWAVISKEDSPSKETILSPASQTLIRGVKGEDTLLAPEVKPKERPIAVRTYRAERRDFRDPLSVMGTIRGRIEINLKCEINGVINAINFREGEKIQKGDVIVALDDKDGRLRLEYNESKLKAAQAAYETSKKKQEIYQGLYDAGAIIKVKLEEANLETENVRLQAEMVKAELRLAESELVKTELRSPRNGIMGSRDVEVGEFVTPNDKVASLVVTDEVYVEVGIIERDINKIKLGQKAEVNVDAYPEREFIGEVDNISALVEGRSRTLTIKIKVPNPQGLLLPGMFTRCQILLVEFKNVIIIPADSLITLTPGAYVVPVVNLGIHSQSDIESGAKLGRIELRNVVLGYESTDYVYVSSGLNEEDLVIIEAQGELQKGAKVKVVGVEEAAFQY